MIITKYFRLKFVLLCIWLSQIAWGQINEGHILFERKVNLEKRYKNSPEALKLIESNKYQIENFHLFFNDSLSLFKPSEIDLNDPFNWSTITVLKNLNTNLSNTLININGTKILVTDSIRFPNWKITDDTRYIGDFNCQKAYYDKNDSVRIYAWYTIEIIPSFGPESLGGLPGMILGLATEDGGIVYFAKSIEISSQQKTDFSIKKKKTITLSMNELIEKGKIEDFSLRQYIIDDLFRWF